MANPDLQKEAFLPDHGLLDDAALLALPPQGPLTQPTLFVCTYEANLGNLHKDFAELTHIICKNLRYPIIAINSNFGHACRPGYEHLLKAPKPPQERLVPMRGRARKIQGDGTCFNSAIEPILLVDHPGIGADKLYKVKCFPTTGKTQVPGVLCPDLSDGGAVLDAFVAYLNELKIGDPVTVTDAAAAATDAAAAATDAAAASADAAAAEPERKEITILSKRPNMLNYKFRIIRTSPRILVNLRALAIYMYSLEITEAVEGKPLSEAHAARFAGWPTILLPPFLVRETKPPTDDVKVSFRFENGDRMMRNDIPVGKKRTDVRKPRVNVFQEGKINILGADSAESAQKIYSFFINLFKANWSMLICLQPRRDLELRMATKTPKSAPTKAPVRLTDSEIDSLFNEIFEEPVASSLFTKTTFHSGVRNIIEDINGWEFDEDDEGADAEDDEA